MSFLLDTNVISELRKGTRCHPAVLRWFEGVAADEVFLSVLTVGEIRRGIEAVRRRDPDFARTLDDWLDLVTTEHAERILGVSRDVAEEWGRLNVPVPLPAVDGLLAATARVHGLTLVTRNIRDVERAGIRVVDPFADVP